MEALSKVYAKYPPIKSPQLRQEMICEVRLLAAAIKYFSPTKLGWNILLTAERSGFEPQHEVQVRAPMNSAQKLPSFEHYECVSLALSCHPSHEKKYAPIGVFFFS